MKTCHQHDAYDQGNASESTENLQCLNLLHIRQEYPQQTQYDHQFTDSTECR